MKHLQTTAAREKFENQITSRMESLKRAWEASTDEADRANFNDMYNALNEQWLYARQSKEWLYNFKSGGFNSSTGADKEQAIKKAKERWGNTTSLVIDEDTFRLSTPDEEKHLLSLFY